MYVCMYYYYYYSTTENICYDNCKVRFLGVVAQCHKRHMTFTSAWQEYARTSTKCGVRPIERLRNGYFLLCAVLHALDLPSHHTVKSFAVPLHVFCVVVVTSCTTRSSHLISLLFKCTMCQGTLVHHCPMQHCDMPIR